MARAQDREPANESVLAAQLIQAWPRTRGIRLNPYSAASCAAELCVIGRRFRRLSEPPTVVSAERLSAVEVEARHALRPWGRQARLCSGDNHLAVETTFHGTVVRTVLL